MEPLSKDLRDALKKAHPGLTDELIDRYEEMVQRRFQLDPRKRAAIVQADAEIAGFAKRHLPRLAQISQTYYRERRPIQKTTKAVLRRK